MHRYFANTLSALLGMLALGAVTAVYAADDISQLRVLNGRFEPETLTVAANAPLKLQVVNSDTAAIEFESFELNRERIVPPGQSVTVFIPALNPGTYRFFDDFHRDTTQGTLVVK